MDSSEATSLREPDQSQLMAHINTLEHRVERYQESLAQLEMGFDNIGWDPLNGARHDDTGLDLDHIKRASQTAQALITGNPLAKRGIAVRTSYVWGSGVSIPGTETNPSLRRILGSTDAQFEIERTLATDGNLFVEREGNSYRRIPLAQICAAVEHADEPGVLIYLLRRYRDYNLTTRPGVAEYTEVEEWVPTTELEGAPLTSIRDGSGKPIPVARNKRIKHVAINRLVGWWWGVPDLYAILPWSKAYKEYLEDCNKLNKAYAQFAWQYRNDSRQGMERAAEAIASVPGVDPRTGESTGVGATMIHNGSLSALQTVRPVDFDSGRPMAALIAAGLEIPLQVLTSDAGQGGSRTVDQTLDESTKNAMIARQQIMDGAIRDLVGAGVEIDWPQIGKEPEHRQMQALDMAVRMGALFPKEMRAQVARVIGVEIPKGSEPPTKEELPAVLASPEPGEQDPAQVEPMSYGDHELRDEGTQEHTQE